MLCKNCFRKLHTGCDEVCCDLKIYLDIFSSSKATELCIDNIDILSTEDEDFESTTWAWCHNEYNTKTLKRLIIALHVDGKNEMEIAYHLPCSQPYIHKIITKFKTNTL